MPHSSICLLGTSKWEKGIGDYKEREIEGRPHKNRGLCWLPFTLPGSSPQSAWLRPSCWPRAGGGGTWFAGSLAGVAHQTPTGRQSPPPGQRTGTQAGSGAGPLRWWSTCSWRNWGSHTGTPGSQRCHWDPAVGRCSSGLGERKGAFQYSRRTLRLCQREGRSVLDDHETPFPGAPSGPAHARRRRGSGVTGPECKLACTVLCPHEHRWTEAPQWLCEAGNKAQRVQTKSQQTGQNFLFTTLNARKMISNVLNFPWSLDPPVPPLSSHPIFPSPQKIKAISEDAVVVFPIPPHPSSPPHVVFLPPADEPALLSSKDILPVPFASYPSRIFTNLMHVSLSSILHVFSCLLSTRTSLFQTCSRIYD